MDFSENLKTFHPVLLENESMTFLEKKNVFFPKIACAGRGSFKGLTPRGVTDLVIFEQNVILGLKIDPQPTPIW